MIGPCQIKVCGITRAADAAAALHLGADWLGINAWAGSPRFVDPPRRAALLREITEASRVAVTVNASTAEVLDLLREGFAAVQVHFDPAERLCEPAALSSAAGPDRLWLAPRLPAGAKFPETLLPLASTFVHDAHRADAYGGTGLRGDWDRHVSLQSAHPDRRWILAGGLGPDNVAEAAARGVKAIDLNSGVELAPGLKSVEKLHLVRELLRKNIQK
ncbi:MAG: phosphoribosylanthranilate isomerase [Opitutia bacterium]